MFADFFCARRRQSSALACRPPSMSCWALAIVLGLLFTQRLAHAQDLLEGIEFSSSGTVAPAQVQLRALVRDKGQVLAFDWRELEAIPRCVQSSCELQVPYASCREARLTITDFFGETESAQTSVCLGDAAGEPPAASLDINRGSEEVSVAVIATEGSDPIFETKLWVDGVLVEGDSVTLRRQESVGCQAIDAVVADEAGRVGIARNTHCWSAEAPQVWLGSNAPCELAQTPTALCVESGHPLGLPLQAIPPEDGAPLPLEGCLQKEISGVLEPTATAVEDERGVRSTATLLTCASSTISTSLFFAKAVQPIQATEGATLAVSVALAGGAAPYRFEAELVPQNSVGLAPLPLVDWVPNGSQVLLRFGTLPVGPNAWRLVARGWDRGERAARFEALIEVADKLMDAGVPDAQPDLGTFDMSLPDGGNPAPSPDGGPPTQNAAFSACSATRCRPGRSASSALILGLFVLGVFRRRR